MSVNFLSFTFALLLSYCMLKYRSVAGGGEQTAAGAVSSCMQCLLCETNIQCNSILRAEYSEGISMALIPLSCSIFMAN